MDTNNHQKQQKKSPVLSLNIQNIGNSLYAFELNRHKNPLKSPELQVRDFKGNSK